MIEVTRFNGTRLWVNALLIERVEQTPDTVVTLTTGRQYVVRETPAEVREAMVAYLRGLQQPGETEEAAGEVARLIR